MTNLIATLSPEDRLCLVQAYHHLEYPSLAARLTSVVGTPIETAVKLLPKKWYGRFHGCVEAAVAKALDTAISSLRVKREIGAHGGFYRLLSVTSGALGGFFGLPALFLELPITTTIMLRAIADIARSEGEDLQSLEARLACMEVFALGGRSEADDAAETGYYSIRLAMTLPIASALEFIAEEGVTKKGAPIIARFVIVVAERFGTAVTEKTAAQIIPVLGAAGGAVINTIFIQHFQAMAKSHFSIRRLERKYSPELIQTEYEKLKRDVKNSIYVKS